jgi:hypothetical protein
MKVQKRILNTLPENKIISIYSSWDAAILGVYVENNKPVVYYKNDPNKDQEFRLYLKAVETDDDEFEDFIFRRYISTAILDDGAYVLHFFSQS